ncbi:MAG: hypothetical protein B6242_08915 [Anaerolineaceae bacterium 4572_78]|nr:MAG: hypothetical protein B6242_08915 [Anaerolineaceae bacterium 4572_78]
MSNQSYPPHPPESFTEYEEEMNDTQQETSTNWLLFVIVGILGLVVISCIGLAVIGFFFFRSDTTKVKITPEPAETLNVAQYVTDPNTEPEQQTPEPTPNEAIASSLPENNPYFMTSPDYSIHAFLFWREETADRDLTLIKDMGFRWVKQIFAWREIEGAEKGAFNWQNTDRLMDQISKRNLKVIARLDSQPAWAGGGFPEIGPPDNYQDFADFAFALATRYKGRIGAYQIWNEPNLSREWGNRPPSPAEYTELLKVTYQAIKRADPDAIVISAGLAPTTRNDHVAMPDTYFVQGMYDVGAAPYFDMLGVHGAGYKAPPEMDPADVARDPNYSNRGDHESGVPEELRRIYCFRHVEDVRKIMVENGDEEKRVAVLEFGWTIDYRPDSPYRWHRVKEKTQGEYFKNAFLYAKENWQPWIGIMTVIYMPNSEWTEEDEQWFWGILVPKFPDTWPRPAYYQLKDLPKD